MAHELTMIIRYGWLDLDEMMILDCIPSLHLPPSSPFPIFIFSLVLSHSCSFRERERVRNRRVKWVGAASAEVWCIHFDHMTNGAKV